MAFDLSAIERLIGSVGFPIVMCVLFVCFGYKAINANTKAIEALKDAINELKTKFKGE